MIRADDATIRLGGVPLTGSRHVCGFFRDDAEFYSVLLPFIREGIEVGDRAYHIVDTRQRDTHLERLAGAGIQVGEAMDRGQLEVKGWEDAYLRDQRFEQDAMLELIEDVLRSGPPAGWQMTRLVARMEWALEDFPGVDDIVEYESRLNYILPRYSNPVICNYDLGKFSAAVIADILRTHPFVLLGGSLQENPFYVPPDQFLSELASRRK